MYDLFDEKIIEPWGFGVHTGISEEEYHSIKAVSKSSMPHAMRTMKHLAGFYKEEYVQTPDQYKGQLLHKAFLEPEWCKENMVHTAFKTKALKGYKEMVKDEPNKLILSLKESLMVKSAMASFEDDFAEEDVPVMKALSNGMTEVTIFAKDPETGLILKARMDYVTKDDQYIIDYKTITDASPPIPIELDEPPAYTTFQKNALAFKYHVQEAFYMWMAELAGIPKKHFIFILQEKEAPSDYTFNVLQPFWVDEGREMFRTALNTIAEKSKAGDWSGYSKRVFVNDLPAWGNGRGWTR